MSLRLQMLQVARLASRQLGGAADLVGSYLAAQLAKGGAPDRAGKADLYYTIFALAGLEAMGGMLTAESPSRRTLEAWVQGFGDGAGLDFIHLGALARCRAALGMNGLEQEILARLDEYRTPDGGYHENIGASYGHAYGCFVALGAHQDLGRTSNSWDAVARLRMVQCLKLLETPDGAWGNVRGMRDGTVPATAAAVTLLHQLAMPVNQSVGDWLMARQHESGGWLAIPGAPIPDLLSTATALHALSCLDQRLSDEARERCLDFIDSLWDAKGGFHGHWADDDLDAEYTFYGLLALGHLSVP